METTTKVSKKVFSMTKDEYNAVKNTVNFKNYNRVPNANNSEGGFWFFSK